MEAITPQSVVSVAENRDLLSLAKEARIDDYLAQMDPLALFGVETRSWFPGVCPVAKTVFGELADTSSFMTPVGYFAVRGHLDLVLKALKPVEGLGQDPLALQTSRGQRVGLVQYLCMVPLHFHLQHLQAILDAVGLEQALLQPLVDDVFNRPHWLDAIGEHGSGEVMRAGGMYHLQAMAMLALRGARFNEVPWARSRSDLLVHLVDGLANGRIARDQDRRDMLAKAIDVWAGQGFGCHPESDKDPVLWAVQMGHPQILGSLLAHGFDPDRRTTLGSPRDWLPEVDRVPQERQDAVSRCTDLLASATSAWAARRIVAELELPLARSGSMP